ncbi:MAG TPA: 3-hydroxyacyl-CoA dehydrogenase NAD-binding domain-containing protein [Thermoanaerobaculia bacterium]|nr:3-hydroxyacyl-CoA dehydrogenase NAD-binding domain-containing protein [Thermoanaerobaculia bacterium]
MTSEELSQIERGDPERRAFRLERRDDLGILWFDLPGEKVNKLSTSVMAELDELVDGIAATSDMKRLVIASGKPSIFIAGADINEFQKVTSSSQAEEFTRFGQRVFSRIAALPQITIAAVHGGCMGGGTELILNCDYRVASDGAKTVIALPEVRLGIFPAWTGTTRLPRLIGIPAALDMILTGRSLDASRARRIGLVDEVVPEANFIESVERWVSKLPKKRKEKGRTHFYLEGNPLVRRMIFRKARRSVVEKSGEHYPAPFEAIDVMELGFRKGYERGLEAEARGASRLIMGEVAQNLVRVFFMMEDSKKDPVKAEPREIRHAGIVGAGLMGGGIAQLIADKADVDVRLRDINWEALAGAMKTAGRLWKKKVQRRRMRRTEMERKLSLLTTTTDWSGYWRTDLLIEAVVEKLEVKQQVLREVEQVARPEAIFATNTSTIPVSEIAAAAARPENVVGMHFFNPVDKMPLVEVIRGAKSSDAAVVSVAAFARKLGKTVVHCNDAPGFIVNRILAPYINEAVELLEEGSSIEAIDEAMVGFGMPMGPLALLDEVGIDVAAKAAIVMAESFPDRMTAPRSLPRLLEDGRLGRKNGRGLYLYEEGKRRGPDRGIYKLAGVEKKRESSPEAMIERMVLAMINEASRLLDERIAGSASELDLAMIMGTGFPPFRGGLARHADALGIPYVVARLDDLQQKVGERFSPAPPLRRAASAASSLYAAYPKQ